MSQDFLSQEEVNALLKGVTGECDEERDDAYDDKSYRKYDLARQERIVRGRMPTMELINERFARLFRIEFYGEFGRSTEISVGPIRVQKYSEFIRNLVVPTNLNLISCDKLNGKGLLVFDPNLIFLTVDNVFGGDGRFHTRVEGRDFTNTEQMVIDRLFNAFTKCYLESSAAVFPLNFKFERREMNTQFANIATPSEIVVAVTFTVELTGNSAELHLCLPYSMLEPIRDKLYSTMHSESIPTNDFKIEVDDIPVIASIRTFVGASTLAELCSFEVGDFIGFHHDDDNNMEVAIHSVSADGITSLGVINFGDLQITDVRLKEQEHA